MKIDIKKTLKEIKKISRGKVIPNEPMWKHTSLRIGGNADIYFEPMNKIELKESLSFFIDNKIPWMILGGGTNLLVSDDGIEGVVVNVCKGLLKLKIFEPEKSPPFVEAEAGVFMPHLLNFINSHQMSGLDFLAGIPGTVGGAIKMNAGTAEGEIKDVEGRFLILKEGKYEVLLKNNEMGFSYRKSQIEDNDVIIEGCFYLKKGIDASSEKTREIIRKKRFETQPFGLPSAGSIFLNPSRDVFAGKLIELCGIKGMKMGGAEISNIHANFIVNNRGATAKDVLNLIKIAREKVKEKFGITLNCEVKIVGRNFNEDF